MKPRTIQVTPMGLAAVGHRQRMRELSLGPIAWGSWSWTFQDGSCWVAMAFKSENQTPKNMIGWSMLTMETDVLPVIACYVDEPWRGQGVGSGLVTTLLSTLRDSRVLSRRDTIFAALERWPKFEELAADCGINCKLWE